MNREIIGEFLLSEGFRSGGVVMVSGIISILARKASRNDKYEANRWNDYAFGLDVMISASLLIVTRSIDRLMALYNSRDQTEHNIMFSMELASDFWFACLAMLIITIMAQLIRRWGWKNANDLNMIGVLLPNAISLAFLYYIMIDFF